MAIGEAVVIGAGAVCTAAAAGMEEAGTVATVGMEAVTAGEAAAGLAHSHMFSRLDAAS